MQKLGAEGEYGGGMQGARGGCEGGMWEGV